MTWDRRDGSERRRLGLVPENLERSGRDRRAEERRDSPRIPQRLWVKDDAESGLFHVFDGEVGLGGASWTTRWPPLDGNVEVRFRIPDLHEEVAAPARIVRVSEDGDEARVHVVFNKMKVRTELALARHLQNWEQS